MAVFSLDAVTSHPLDFRLMVNGPVTAFWRDAVLEDALQWLYKHSYRVVSLDAQSWRDETGMHADLAEGLTFPAHYGRNWSALNDCLGDVAEGEYGWSSSDAGLVLVLRRFDHFQRRDPESAHALLNAFARQSRVGALLGHRLMCLVKSDDATITVPPVGATPVAWNDAEWMDSSRR